MPRLSQRSASFRIAIIAGSTLAALSLTGCEKLMKDMYDQPRYKPLAPSPLWPDGASARPIEPGTVVHSAGAIASTSSGRSQVVSGEPAANPTPTLATLQRGRERFDIYCAPCHSEAGDGDGMIVRRGFPRPSSFHIDRLRNATDDYFYSVITNGYGAMYPYADRIAHDDRWAIVGYIRALQLSQHATLDDVPAAQRETLHEAAR